MLGAGGVIAFKWADDNGMLSDSFKALPVSSVNEVKAGEGVVKDGNVESSLPVIPETITSVTEAQRIREQLEFIRADIEHKTQNLMALNETYKLTKSDVEKRLEEIEKEKRFIDETIQKEKEIQKERLEDTIKIVGRMEPKKAAPVIATMDKDLVVNLFKALPEQLVSQILLAMDPNTATELMEYYAKVRSLREYEILQQIGLCANNN